ncbi:GAG1At protein [Perilla frutescens var. hirtella]|uniref:GAG1At protein n=1 Tax=Perilla frutescens var. hirtella TaxID=608512 RepID=A0AAD4IMA9_PERFH|nr:GAG1At protein [Perilla frutescens var. hirtella]
MKLAFVSTRALPTFNSTSVLLFGSIIDRAKLHYYLYSGEKKHVFGGIAIIGVLFGVPWYLMTRGAKHQSHQDYLEKADKARSERLSAGSSTIR